MRAMLRYRLLAAAVLLAAPLLNTGCGRAPVGSVDPEGVIAGESSVAEDHANTGVAGQTSAGLNTADLKNTDQPPTVVQTAAVGVAQAASNGPVADTRTADSTTVGSAKPAGPAAIDGQGAVALLRRAADFTGKRPQATLDFAYHLRVTKGDEEQKVDSSYRLHLGEGGRFALGPVGDTQGPRAYADGAEMVVIPPGNGADALRFRTTHGVAAFAGTRQASWIGHGLGGLTLSLLSPVGINELLRAVEQSELLGDETIRVGDAEHRCRHGRVTTGDLTWDFWVDAGDAPLLRRLDLPNLGKDPEAGTPPEEVERVRIVIDFNRWDLTSPAPKGAYAVGEPPHPMLGKQPAPVTLPLLGGGTQRLADLLGKKVIVLDFWATWCPPCVGSLPTLDKVAAEYADRGVVAFAVNAGEEVAELESFLAERDWKLPIVLDQQGEISDTLKPGNGLPTSLIIGLDGRVQIAAAGVPASTEAYRKKLEEELDALLAKKDLATESINTWRQMEAVFANKK